MWCLLTSHSVLPHQSSVCQQYKTTWLDATVSKHPIRSALFFFNSCIYFFESIRATPGPHVSLSSPLVKRIYLSAAGSDHVNIWTLNINCDLYPLGKNNWTKWSGWLNCIFFLPEITNNSINQSIAGRRVNRISNHWIAVLNTIM